MATQKCPRCKSNRIRVGYRPTPTLMKLVMRYHLLCDQCNWQFVGFAIPGTVRKKTKSKSTGAINEVVKGDEPQVEANVINEIFAAQETVEVAESVQEVAEFSEPEPEKKEKTVSRKVKVRRKVKKKLS